MRTLPFRILNVFTVDGGRFTGNPLAVFEDGRSLGDEEMQAIARQMNLSETTFILPPTVDGVAARVRIFTPAIEMPFAGHPTLGTASVVRSLTGLGAAVDLEMKAGRVPVVAEGDRYTLRAAKPAEASDAGASPSELAAMLNVPEGAIAGPARWISTGTEQLVVPLRSEEDVRAAFPDPGRLSTIGYNPRAGESMVYVWSKTSERTVVARFFFLVQGGVVEDPATGSAAANLGGYLACTGHDLPVRWTISQGTAVGRPSRLGLRVEDASSIFVSGEVIEVGRGVLTI